MTGQAPNERDALDALKAKLARLSRFFSDVPLPRSEDPKEWYPYLASFKDDLGNIHNDVSLLATLMAKDFLLAHFDLDDFDVAAKPQGAPGLDLDLCTRQGGRIIAEIKSISPYKSDDFGAAQAKTVKKDAEKLTRETADHKFFFVTERRMFEALKKPKYRSMFNEIRVVLLPGGDEIAAA